MGDAVGGFSVVKTTGKIQRKLGETEASGGGKQLNCIGVLFLIVGLLILGDHAVN